MKDQNRTDRIIIIAALAVLLLASGLFYFDDWMWGGRRGHGEHIGVIASRRGDVRSKFAGDLKWQRAATGQDLIYNDAIYAGADSSARVQLGESEMTVTENSLVVFRRDQNIDFMNLAYGSLFGKIAQNEKVIIETGSGEPLELIGSQDAQIVVKKVKGHTTVDVLSGEADMMVDGKKKRINKTVRLVLDGATPPRLEALTLQLVKPLQGQVLYSEDPARIDLEWRWSNDHQPAAADVYKVEFANTPSFNSVESAREVHGSLSTALDTERSLNLYCRVKGPRNEASPVGQISFVRMVRPLIVRPVAGSRFLTPSGVKAMVELEFQRPEQASVQYQVADSPDFKTQIVSENTTEFNRVVELAPGRYYIRAKSAYAQTHSTSWTESVPFQVELKLESLPLAEMPGRSKVIIPNRAYPPALYASEPGQVKDYLYNQGLLNRFFPGDFDQLRVAFNGAQQPEIVNQTGANWPKMKLRPGRFTFKYQGTKQGFAPTPWSAVKKLEISMEPPRPVGEPQYGPTDKDGMSEAHLRFTPLLFAKSYDVELSPEPGFHRARELKVEQPEARAPVSGEIYWRVRARDGQGRIISEFSRPAKLQGPVPQYLAKNPPPARMPATTESTTARIDSVRVQEFTKNGWWGWVGSGVNFVDYRQSVPGQLSFEDQHTKGPSQYVETGFVSDGGWGGVFSYKNTPGEIQSSNAVIDDSTYNWTTVAMEGLYQRPAPFTLFGSPVVYGMRLGVQNQIMPFVFVDEFSNEELKYNEMLNASAGGNLEWRIRKWTFYWLMRYQYPLTSKADGAAIFNIQPTFDFDGSVGASYNLSRQFKLGVFWYGQWHQFGFTYSDGTQVEQGFQSLFYSSLDLRLGLDF